jgi:bifunctional pyridoxal-dependent enzyme with beta-cystathionase and maltose regulon repressor activities
VHGFGDAGLTRLRRRRTVKRSLSGPERFGPGCAQRVRLNFATSRALLGRIVTAMGAAARSR